MLWQASYRAPLPRSEDRVAPPLPSADGLVAWCKIRNVHPVASLTRPIMSSGPRASESFSFVSRQDALKESMRQKS